MCVTIHTPTRDVTTYPFGFVSLVGVVGGCPRHSRLLSIATFRLLVVPSRNSLRPVPFVVLLLRFKILGVLRLQTSFFVFPQLHVFRMWCAFVCKHNTGGSPDLSRYFLYCRHWRPLTLIPAFSLKTLNEMNEDVYS